MNKTNIIKSYTLYYYTVALEDNHKECNNGFMDMWWVLWNLFKNKVLDIIIK